jgi:hypothetical protein
MEVTASPPSTQVRLPAGSLQIVHSYLIPGISLAPVVIERLVTLLWPSDYDRVLEQGRFTPREIVAHLADWEPIMRDRIVAAVDSPGSVIPAYDEAQMALDHGYAATDIVEQAKLFHEERKKTVKYVAGLSAEELARSVTHPERGVLTADDLAGLLLGHDMYHVEQLSAYLMDRVAATW